jgi:hypothetical protein
LNEESTVRQLKRLKQAVSESIASSRNEDILILAEDEDSCIGLDEYEDLRFIQPTSNHCERMFSAAGRCLDELRHRLLPVNFDATFPVCKFRVLGFTVILCIVSRSHSTSINSLI